MGKRFLLIVGVGALCLAALFVARRFAAQHPTPNTQHLPAFSPFQRAVADDLQRQVERGIVYRADYFTGGEPPPGIGVCTDVVLRSYRAAGVPLQAQVNADIAGHRNLYPLTQPDPNIDHRRCRNLIVFFRRHARTLPDNADWRTGDVVFWDTSGHKGVDHVGVVGTQRDADGNLSVVHHWPGRPVQETDDLYSWKIRGHFRWKPG